MEGRLPFKLSYLEDMVKRANGTKLLKHRLKRRHVNVTMEEIDAVTYSDISGHLKTMCDALGEIAAGLNEDGTNHEETLRDWYAAFMDGIMTYSEGSIRPVSRGRSFYAELFDKYSRVLRQAFVAADVSAEVNYEALEFLGDGQWKAALVAYFVRERRISNESILTVLKHTHENTKALSDLARLFHMEKLMRQGGMKQYDSVCEDVFEAVMGALQLVQWELQRDLTNPEAYQFCSDNGFSNRLVRIVFGCSDASYTHLVAPKTFITSLKRIFGGDSEAIYTKEEITATSIQISFHTKEDVVARMAQLFGCSAVSLGGVLNAFYETKSARVNSKHFSSLVYGDLVKRLSELGIDQGSLQTKKNHSMVPQTMHARLDVLSAKAAEKGYWLAINAPKTKGDSRILKLQASLYHDDPGGHVQKVTEQVAGATQHDRERAFSSLFDRAEVLIEAVARAGPKDHGVKDARGKTRFSVRIGERHSKTEEDVRAPERPALNWAYRASMTSIGHSAISQGAVANANQKQERKNRSLCELYLALTERSQTAHGIHADLLGRMIGDQKLRSDFIKEMSSEGSDGKPVVAALCDKAQGSYAIIEFTPAPAGKPAILVRGSLPPEFQPLLGQLASSLQYDEPKHISHADILSKMRQWASQFPGHEKDYPELGP